MSCARGTFCLNRAIASRGPYLLEHEQEREILPEADLDNGTLVYC